MSTVVVPDPEGASYLPEENLLLGRCYAQTRTRPDGTIEGVGTIVAGPVTFHHQNEYHSASVACASCGWYEDLDGDDARAAALALADAHLCAAYGSVDVR